MYIDKGTIIYLEDEQYFTLPKYVTKVRLEVHGGKGGKGGNSLYTTSGSFGSPGSNGSRISCILDLSKVPTPSRTLYAVMGHNGADGGDGSRSAGGGGGGGSSAILLGDILIIQARGGNGGKGGHSGKSSSYGGGGKGGKGYINGGNGESGSYSSGGAGGAGGGRDYIFEGLERVNVTTEYTPGLLLLEVLEVLEAPPTLIKSNNKYYTYQDNEFIEVEPTVENFKEKSIRLFNLITPTNKVVLTMEEGEDLGDGKIFRKSINADKYGYIEGLTTQEM